MTLTKADKNVIQLFTEHEAGSSKRLESDGTTLRFVGFLGGNIAKWVEVTSEGRKYDHIKLIDTGGKNGDQVHRAIRKAVPKYWIL